MEVMARVLATMIGFLGGNSEIGGASVPLDIKLICKTIYLYLTNI